MIKDTGKFGDLPQDIQDACWENDPSLLPWSAEDDRKSIQRGWEHLAAIGYSPERAFPNDPEKRAAMRAYLQTIKP